MQRLILMRHAEAERAAASGRDRDRALSATGCQAAALMGQALADRNIRPDHALVSAATRTRETWDLTQRALGDAEVVVEDQLYNAGADTIRRFVEGMEDRAGCLIVVAHNPGVHDLAVTYLLESAASPALLERLTGGFPPGAAVIFSIDLAGRPTFEGYLRPQDLVA